MAAAVEVLVVLAALVAQVPALVGVVRVPELPVLVGRALVPALAAPRVLADPVVRAAASVEAVPMEHLLSRPSFSAAMAKSTT